MLTWSVNTREIVPDWCFVGAQVYRLQQGSRLPEHPEAVPRLHASEVVICQREARLAWVARPDRPKQDQARLTGCIRREVRTHARVH